MAKTTCMSVEIPHPYTIFHSALNIRVRIVSCDKHCKIINVKSCEKLENKFKVDEDTLSKINEIARDVVEKSAKLVTDFLADSDEEIDASMLDPLSCTRLSELPKVLASKEKKLVLIIEEPEQGLTPPQQVLLGLVLGKMVDYINKNTDKKRIITLLTNSPYILAGAKMHAKSYYIYVEKDYNGIKIEERPYASFAVAEYLAMSINELL